MKKSIFVLAAVMFLSAAAPVFADTPVELLRDDSLDLTLGTGFIGIDGQMNRVWTNGYEIELDLGYRFKPDIGIETGGIIGFTGTAENLKITASGIDQYGDEETGSTEGGLFIAFPLGLTFSWQVPSTNYVLMAGGGADFDFESEQGLGDVPGYRPRSTAGFGYYLEGGAYICAGDGTMKLGIRFRFMDNNSGVKDFATAAFGNASKRTADDIRYMMVIEAGGL